MRIGKRDVMEVLSEKDVIPIMLLIREKQIICQSDLRTINKNTSKIARTAEELEYIGLLSITIKTTPRKVIQYSLTKRGEKLADLFQQAVIIAHED